MSPLSTSENWYFIYLNLLKLGYLCNSLNMKLLITIAFLFTQFNLSTNTNLKVYYNVLENGTLLQVNKQLGTTLSSAKKGAMLMKKADLLKKPGEKLKVFKEGNKFLEAAIKKSPKSIENRFLRLIIQENSPKFLKYNMNIAEDRKFVSKGYKNTSNPLKEIIQNYLEKDKK